MAPLPRSHFVRVSEARARGALEERGDHRGHAAALCRPARLLEVVECRQLSGLRGQPRTPPQPPQIARAVLVGLCCPGGQCGAAFWFAGACDGESGGLLRAGWRARPPFDAAATPVRQRLRYAAGHGVLCGGAPAGLAAARGGGGEGSGRRGGGGRLPGRAVWRRAESPLECRK